MAVSDSAKVDLLYKKLFGVAKTDLPGNKSPSNEAIASPSLSRIDKLWTQALSIPATAAATTGIVQAYTGASAVQCTADATTTPISSVYPSWKTNLTDWIPSEFGSTYFVQVWVDSSGVANPTSTGTQIFDSGIAGVGEWNFDYQSGVLNFIGGTIPATLTSSKVIYVVGYRYIGYKATNFSNISVGNINISGNTISSSSGNVYISGNLTINGPAVSIGTSDLAIQDPILNLHTFANLAPLTYNDGYDIGLKMHYYDGVDTHAFLGRGNDTGYLEWYASGNDTANVFVGTAYGTIKTGELILANTTAATGANTGGALRVWGGAAIAGNVFVGNILTDGYCYSNGAPFTSYTNADVALYLPTYTGNISAGNIILQNTLYTDTISANVGNVVTVLGTGAVKVPIGTTAQRPTSATAQIRYNTDIGGLEYYNGTEWAALTPVITDQAIVGDGSTQTFTLSQPASANGLLVSINGVLQNPNIGAYSVAGDQITFSEAPLATDSIDVRFIASLTSMPGTISNDLSVLGNLTVTGNITSLTGIYTYGNTQVGQYLNHLPGNIVPSANVTYSLGTSTNQWRDLWVSNNTIYIGNTPITVSGGTLLINNSPITGGTSTYSNTNVAAYLTTDATVTTLQANLGVTQTWANANIASINANIGGFYSWANTNFGTSSYSNTNANALLSSNTISTINTTGNIKTIANVIGTTFMFANGVNILSTVGSTYSNTNVAAYLTTATISTTGNITAGNLTTSGTYTVANIATTGAYGNITGANVISANTISATNFVYSANGISILTGIGGTYSNTNVAAYLTTDSTVIALQANLGVTQIWANANIATINANLGSYQTWANANAATQATSINSLATGANTNTAAYLAAGISTNVTTTGNISAGNLLGTHYGNTIGTTATYSGNVAANYFTGNGAALRH